MAGAEGFRDPGTSPEAVSFGEIVFDLFEEEAHLGGAPLNFAFYLRQFGVSVALVSAVGRDALGERAVGSLAAAGIDTTWVESGTRPTGTVDVSLVDGEPRFTVSDGAAWEAIRIGGDLAGLRPELLYFGTVALKTAANRATLRTLGSLGPRHILLDLNLRPGQHSRDLVMKALDMATIVKMNEEEWQFVREMTSQGSLAGLMEDFGLEMIALTRGPMPATLYVSGEKYVEDVARVTVADTIGAGDAFSAALAAGVIRGRRRVMSCGLPAGRAPRPWRALGPWWNCPPSFEMSLPETTALISGPAFAPDVEVRRPKGMEREAPACA